MQIAPSEFWNMTPTEYYAIFHARYDKPKTQGMSRSQFDELLQKVPSPDDKKVNRG